MNQQIWTLFNQVVHSAGVGDIHAWVKLDLTMSQMKILMILNFKDEAMVSSLAEMMHTSLPNMTGILDRLEAQHLVERVPNKQDRRVITVRLTPQAKEIFQTLNQAGYDKISRVVGTMTEPEQKMVELGLQTLLTAMNREKNV